MIDSASKSGAPTGITLTQTGLCDEERGQTLANEATASLNHMKPVPPRPVPAADVSGGRPGQGGL